jgi:hypothetical protein
MAELAPDTVATRLRVEPVPTLEALEDTPISRDVALAAAPGLVDLCCVTEEREVFERSTLALAHLLADAAPAPAAVYGAAFADERWEAYYGSRWAVAAAGGSSEKPLTREDAISYACLNALEGPARVRGYTAPETAAGRTVGDGHKLVS